MLPADTIYSVEVNTPESALPFLEQDPESWNLPEDTRDWIKRTAYAHQNALQATRTKLEEKGASYEQWKISTLALYENHVKLTIEFDAEVRNILQVTAYDDFGLTNEEQWLITLVRNTMDAVRGRTVYYRLGETNE